MDPESGMLRTDVDDFLDLIKKKGKVSIQEAAQTLKVSIETIQAWADFLCEERIVGDEYKFTTRYVYMETPRELSDARVSYAGFDTKEEFYAKARRRELDEGTIRHLWLKYLDVHKESIKQSFFEKSKKRGLDENKMEVLWYKYLSYLQS